MIAGNAAQGGIKKEPDGGIAAGIPKEPAERRWKGNYRMLNIAACAKAESSNDAKLFRVKEIFPQSQLTFPVKEENKAVILEILEEIQRHEEAHTRSSENMLAQTPHDIVPREPAHNAGGASNSEQVPESQKQGQVAPTTKDKGNKNKKKTLPPIYLCLAFYNFMLRVGKLKGRGETLAHAQITVVTRLRTTKR